MRKRLLQTIAAILILGAPFGAEAAFTNSVGLAKSSSQYLSRADNATLSFTGNFTLEGWFKFTTFQSDASNSGEIISKYGGGTNQRAYLVGYQNGNSGTTLRFAVSLSNTGGGGTGVTQTFLNYTLSTGTWYHLAYVYTASAGTVDIYVNGVSVGQMTGQKTSIFDSTSSFDIGTSDGDLPGTTFDGRAFLVRAWSTTRTAGQISANMCNDLGATTGLAGEWTLDNTLADDSGNSFTLTNNNSATFGADVPATCNPVATSITGLIHASWF